MRKKISIFIIIFLLVIFQMSFLPNFFQERAIPDLVLIILIFMGARRGFGEVWKMAIAAGLLMDIFSFFPVGTNIASFTFVVLVSSFLARRFLVTQTLWRFFILIFLAALGTALNDLAISSLIEASRIFSEPAGAGVNFWSNDILVKMLNNSILFAIIYWPLLKFEKLRSIYGEKLILKK